MTNIMGVGRSRALAAALVGLLAACGSGSASRIGEEATVSTARGDRVTLWSVGWDDLDSARSAAMAVDTARPDGAALEVVITNGPALGGLDEASTATLRAMLRSGVPVVSAGGEAAVASALGLAVADATEATPGELFAVKMVRGRLARAYFVAVAPRPEVPASVAPAEAQVTAGMRDALLRSALAWAASESRLGAEPSAPAQAAGAGAWNSVSSQEWQWVGVGVNNSTATNVFTLGVTGHKIQDLRADRDWYLADVRVSHQANADGNYSCSHPYCTHGEIGWYVQSRSLKIERNGAQAGAYHLEEYGPTGTIGSGSVSISVGGSLSSSDIGINAGFSKTYNQQDVTISDSSSLFDQYGKWDEDFTCPHGDYSLYPFQDDPAAASSGSFYSDRAVIFRTTDLTGGVSLKFTPRLDAFYDMIDWPWYEFCLGASITRYSYPDGLGAVRTMAIHFNNPPDKPALPSMKTPVQPDEAVEATVTGTDLDGDSLTFSFDFGDGTVSPFGSATQTHTWTTAGTYGVRVKAQDAPHGAISDWSTTFTVDVRKPGGGGGGGCGTSGAAGGLFWLLALLPAIAARRGSGPSGRER
jgi:hypothetical protein